MEKEAPHLLRKNEKAQVGLKDITLIKNWGPFYKNTELCWSLGLCPDTVILQAESLPQVTVF
jgi:hypothetical protein